jgi:hypothetical protein
MKGASTMLPAASAAQPSLDALSRRIEELSAAAVKFVAPGHGEAMARRWLRRSDVETASQARQRAMMADAALLAADLLLSQPSYTGTTAFDLLARSRASDPSAQAAVAALRQARYRLLQLEGAAPAPQVQARDVVSNQVVWIAGAALPALPAGTALFARAAPLPAGVCCLAGAITPLDAPALAVARSHAPPGVAGGGADIHWAEAVYFHIVQHGRPHIPAPEQPADAPGGAPGGADGRPGGKPDPVVALAAAWAALAGGPPDAALLQRTRRSADVLTVIAGFAAGAAAREGADHRMATAFERMLLVQLETILRRERSGSGSLTLDMVRRVLDDDIARRGVSPAVRPLFDDLRQRLAGVGRAHGAGDPGLERLVQRIQGLRAKTVAHGCTEQEALAAAEKAAELLDRYGLSLGELDFRAQPCDGIGILTNRRRMAPIDGCITAIAAFFDCRTWVEQDYGMPLRYIFFGLRGDVAAAEYLYEMVERAFETETDAFRASRLYAQMAGDRRSATNSFQMGLSSGICDKLDAMRAAREAARHTTSGRDLVPVKAAMVDEELAKLGLNLRTAGPARRRRVLSDPFVAGKAAGEKFAFAPGLPQPG